MNKRLTPDLVVALFVLKQMGEEKYPGVSRARIESVESLPDDKNAWLLEEEGALSFYFKDATFPRGSGYSFSRLVAGKLGIEDDYVLEQCIAIAEGREIASAGMVYNLMQNIIKEFEARPEKAIRACQPIITSHFHSLSRKVSGLAHEYTEKFNSGEINAWILKKAKRDVRVLMIESKMDGMTYFLHNHENVQADIVCQVFGPNKVVISASRRGNIDLSDVAAIVRIETAKKKKESLQGLSVNDLRVKGPVAGIEEWTYDPLAPAIVYKKQEESDESALSMKEITTALQLGLEAQNVDIGDENIKNKQLYFAYHLSSKSGVDIEKELKERESKLRQLKENIAILNEDDMVHVSEE
ncbi:hypothetical protein KKH43_01395 [Patescibacteria group bacterium]|nr:hypothetical protein [Patescibacteria group bacterium]